MKRNIKQVFAILAMLPFVFVSCTQETDDQTTPVNQQTINPNKKIVTDMHSIIGKTSTEAIAYLDQICVGWNFDINTTTKNFSYRSPDNTKSFDICYGHYNGDLVYSVNYFYSLNSNPRNYFQVYEDFEDALNNFGDLDNFSGYIQYTDGHATNCFSTRESYLNEYKLKKETMNCTSEIIAFFDSISGHRTNGSVSWSDGTYNDQSARITVSIFNDYIK
ncbi:MAG TPA: hypothetical protein DD434_00405 [Bacteroidales bacterium]|nr:hypothetical protein [Bacteroidales bacterium]